jgi:hypothetical protein
MMDKKQLQVAFFKNEATKKPLLVELLETKLKHFG